MDTIKIRGLSENNLKSIDLEIPKKKIVVFTGVSGSGKSSIVFDTIASESQRQMNETYPAFVRTRLPKYPRPHFEAMENLSPSVVIDQSPLGNNGRSTVGTVSEIYSLLRLLFSRIASPRVGSASFYSFNDPRGMCPVCSGVGTLMDVNLEKIMDKDKSLNGGALTGTFRVGGWYFKQYVKSGFFDPDKPIKDYSEKEMNYLLYGSASGTGEAENPKVIGLSNFYKKHLVNREANERILEKSEELLIKRTCPCCSGRRLNRIALSSWINGYSISDMCEMDLVELRAVISTITDQRVGEVVKGIISSLDRMIDIGLGYLNLSRPTETLSGGEAQRVKLVRHLGSTLSDMIYIFDEPSTGMHPRDVHRMNNLLKSLRDKGNTVLVVEHDEDVIAVADEVIDIGPLAGKDGGRIVFQGPYETLLSSSTLTGRALSERKGLKKEVRKPKAFLPLRNVTLHNLKGVDADIPLGVIASITGVAGSGKSSLMTAFCEKYGREVVKIDQSPITARSRSTPASFMGIMDEIRREFALENSCDVGYFSFNSLGACPECKGKGVIVTELAFMEPVVTVCEKCGGSRYSDEALGYRYKGKNIMEVLSLTVEEALSFFENRKIRKGLETMAETGLSYLTLGQPLSTLSGGERQRLKLALALGKKGNIYVLDEPTTGLHPSDIDKLMALFSRLVDKGNSVILIEHNLEVMKASDYIIDIGPDGGRDGGEVVFSGTPEEMVNTSSTITSECLRASVEGRRFTEDELKKLLRVKKEKREDMAGIRINPIGRTEGENGEYRIVVGDEYRRALKGLKDFSHVMVLCWFDAENRNRLVEKKPYTRGPEEIGVFATRSPERPNPIATTIAKIISVDEEKGIVAVEYLDTYPGTPVLDLKPYTPSEDRVRGCCTKNLQRKGVHSPISIE